MKKSDKFLKIVAFLVLALFLRWVLVDRVLETDVNHFVKLLTIGVIFIIGIGYVFRGSAEVIEETTEVLKDRTKLAGGFLQSFGTAFPDMVIGVVAALMSLSLRSTDYTRAINLAIIAAATTFGSNIYNILHAAWCIWRQNLANHLQEKIPMFPYLKRGGQVIPISQHHTKPSLREMDTAIKILTVLSWLTAIVALAMVLFGRVREIGLNFDGDLYQIIRPVGLVLFVLCVGVLYYFRHSQGIDIKAGEENYYFHQKNLRIWFDLVLSGAAILFAAESMVKAMEELSLITHLPFVITGILAGVIGCFGEMLVIHNFTIHPKGRIGDAVTGVAMDNIVTTLGAAIVAIMGGIFLGGNALIIIFILILAGNTLLIQQIAAFKNYIGVK